MVDHADTSRERGDVEVSVRAACECQDWDGATTAILRAYGSEIFALLLAMHQSPADAEEAFSLFGERLWSTMRRWERACSARTWAYMLARRASRDVRRAAGSRAKRQVALSNDSVVAKLVAQLRTQTLSIYAQDKKDAVALLREELPEEDRMLLVMRVDRELEWQDLARILLDADEPSEEDLRRESARLRKRFQLVKERLLTMGRERGLFPRRDAD